jgi:AcrR family transcriptional regulator
LPKSTSSTAAKKISPVKGAGAKTRERILETSMALFAQRGFAGTSIRDIGKELNLANSSLLHHFPSKKKIYGEIFEQIAQSTRWITEISQENADKPDEIVMTMVKRLVRWGREHPDYLRIIVREMLEVPDRSEEVHHWYMKNFLEQMESPLRQAKQMGLLQSFDVTAFLLIILGTASYGEIAMPILSQISDDSDREIQNGKNMDALFQVVKLALHH